MLTFPPLFVLHGAEKHFILPLLRLSEAVAIIMMNIMVKKRQKEPKDNEITGVANSSRDADYVCVKSNNFFRNVKASVSIQETFFYHLPIVSF